MNDGRREVGRDRYPLKNKRPQKGIKQSMQPLE